VALIPNERMYRVSEPTQLGDAWSIAFEGKTTIEPVPERKPFGGVLVEQRCDGRRDIFRPIDRMSLWLTTFASVGDDPTPPVIEWEIRVRGGNASHRVALVSMSVASWSHTGLIVQVAGVLGTAFEVWARVATSGAKAVRVNVVAVVDRCGAQFERIVGEGVVVLP
jgi:hypothetical protein